MSSAAGRWGPDPKPNRRSEEQKYQAPASTPAVLPPATQPLAAVGSIAHFDPGLGETVPHEVGVHEAAVLPRRFPDLQERFHERPDDLPRIAGPCLGKPAELQDERAETGMRPVQLVSGGDVR